MNDLGQRLEWVEEGTRRFERELDRLADSSFVWPSSLEGWSLAHIVAHVGYNALALCNLLSWARTGVESPMYESSEARGRQIEEGSGLPAEELRQLARSSASKLASQFGAMPDSAWDSEVRTAQGRTVTAAEVPWMRCREIWVHAVDLDQGFTFADYPSELIDALLDDVVFQRSRRGQTLSIVIAPSDRTRTWVIATADSPPVRVTGPAAQIFGWMAGRGGSEALIFEGTGVPDLHGGWL